ncbi:MAG: hypothetical protein ACSHX0_13400 [Akkermansiaceae bacterium]
MDLQDYKNHLKTAFPEAVRHAINNQKNSSPAHKELKQQAFIHHKKWGFACLADCFEAAVPRSIRLELEKWSMSEVKVDHWKMNVSCRAFYFVSDHAHIQVRNTGESPLPFTDTGYKSFFVPLSAFQNDKKPEDFIRFQFPTAKQLELF